MQKIEKKKRAGHPRFRLVLLAVLVLALAGTAYLYVRLKQPEGTELPVSVSTYGELISKGTDEVARLQVTLRGGETWAILQEDGVVSVEGKPDFPVDASVAEDLLEASCVVSYEDILSDDPAEYQDRLADFGLDDPRCVAEITYTDGTGVTLRIGGRSDELDDTFYYMLVDGDDHLYGLDLTTANDLCMELALLHAVEQPVIHKARIDSFSIQQGETILGWALDGSITDADAEDRWFLVSPVRYPAEGETITNLRSNLANLRLGAYVGEATPENLTKYGFDEPRMVLTIHMAAGTVGTVDDDGVYGSTDYPESTVVFTVGGEKSDVVDYVRLGDDIYITSHYSLDVFMSQTAADTLTRYPVRVTLSNLKTLTIASENGTDVYEVDKVEEMDETGELVLDDDGNVTYNYSVTKNGEELSWDAFEYAYYQLIAVTVSGQLPEDWQQTEEVHTLYTFVTRTGTEHTIGLTRFDALHDAVLVDGCAMFYLIRNGLAFNVE